jgi:hypothetical protein
VVRFSLKAHRSSSFVPGGGKLELSMHRSSLTYAGGGKLDLSLHHSSSLTPGGGFIGRLHGDVGGGSLLDSSDDSPSNSLSYNDECPHVKEVSSFELLLDFIFLL